MIKNGKIIKIIQQFEVSGIEYNLGNLNLTDIIFLAKKKNEMFKEVAKANYTFVNSGTENKIIQFKPDFLADKVKIQVVKNMSLPATPYISTAPNVLVLKDYYNELASSFIELIGILKNCNLSVDGLGQNLSFPEIETNQVMVSNNLGEYVGMNYYEFKDIIESKTMEFVELTRTNFNEEMTLKIKQMDLKFEALTKQLEETVKNNSIAESEKLMKEMYDSFIKQLDNIIATDSIPKFTEQAETVATTKKNEIIATGNTKKGELIDTFEWMETDLEQKRQATIVELNRLATELGVKGEKGDQGIQGIQGIQGLRGVQGLKGDRGEQGIQGIQGERGLTGERGEKGDQGIQGFRGFKGDTGDKGEKGEQGVQGLKGDRGEQGKDGQDINIIGVYPNLDALPTEGARNEIFIVEGHGYVYLNNIWTDIGQIVGIQGERGEKGDRGEQGIQGERGEQGIQGVQGIQGFNGENAKIQIGTNGGLLIAGYEITIDIDGQAPNYTTIDLNGSNGGIVFNGVEMVVELDEI